MPGHSRRAGSRAVMGRRAAWPAVPVSGHEHRAVTSAAALVTVPAPALVGTALASARATRAGAGLAGTGLPGTLAGPGQARGGRVVRPADRRPGGTVTLVAH